MFHAFCNRYIMSSLICLILLSTNTFTHVPITQLLISATSSHMSIIYLIASFLGDLTLHKIHLPTHLVISCLSLPIYMVQISLILFVNIRKPVISSVCIVSIFFTTICDIDVKDNIKCNKLGTIAILYYR